MQINSLGSKATREKYLKALVVFLTKNKTKLSSDSLTRLEKNPLRVLDSKDKKDLLVLKKAPQIIEFLSNEEKIRFSLLQKHLKSLKISFVLNPFLVRGLDYYNDLIFEFVSTDETNLGTQSTLIGGGRYDFLVSTLTENKKQINALGLAIGLERLLLASKSYLKTTCNAFKPKFLIITTKIEYNLYALKLAQNYRKQGFSVLVDLDDAKFSKKLERAYKIVPESVIIIGDRIKDGKYTIKNLVTNQEIEKDIKEN